MNLITQKIAVAPMLDYPFNHIVIEDIFPKEFYASLTKELENCKFSEMYNINMFPVKDTQTFDSISSALFEETIHFLESDEFSQCLMRKFRIDENYLSKAALQKHGGDYYIRPHKDIKEKLVTWQIYIPLKELDAKAGTNLCVPKESAEFESENRRHQDWHNFEEVKLIPYKANTLFAFAPNEKSWHSVNMKGIYDDRTVLRGFVFKDTQKVRELI